MNNFVTYADFVGDRNIPNISKDTTSFDSFISIFQKEILIKILGYDLYLAFEAGLAEGSPAAIWTNLRDGIDYEVDSITKQYEGLTDIVAYYVYCKYISANFEQLTGLGNTSADAENATKVSPENKIIHAYNTMINYYGLMFDYISENETDYPNWEFEILTPMTYGF